MKRFWLVGKILFSHRLLSARTNSFNTSVSRFYTSFFITAIFCSATLHAQDEKTLAQQQYLKVITERSAKIVNTLGITDPPRYAEVLNELVNQYASLNTIHEENKTVVNGIRQSDHSKEEKEAAVKQQEEKKLAWLLQQHNLFIAHLKERLSNDQLEKIKDGMTYSVMPKTYAAYQDMLLNLTAEQKNQIYAWLKEARELAMDAESSEKKHAIFGKYKGRINNYLSMAGYDMKKESEAWQQRIKEKKANP